VSKSKPRIERNAVITICLWISTVLLCTKVSFAFVLLPVVVHALNDVLQAWFAVSIFSQRELVLRCYRAADVFLDHQKSDGLDLGFNFYDGDLERPRHLAQEAKWKFMFDKLGLREGHRLIDVGCGYGAWMNYARSRGVEVVGVNLTKAQADYAVSELGLDVRNVDWRELERDEGLRAELHGTFDAVTFMDTIEHYVSPNDRNDPEAQRDVYEGVFRVAHALLRPESSSGRVFISCLHKVRADFNARRRVAQYLLERTICGFYPFGDDGLTRHAAGYFRELERFDKTEDYRLTGVLEAQHFQQPRSFRLNLSRVLTGLWWLLVDPYFLHRLFGLWAKNWMSLWGNDPYVRRYDPEGRSKVTFVREWMLVLERV
jgi:cyclopropane fatty-acyl-phospholipid synthase-like methyltransferase